MKIEILQYYLAHGFKLFPCGNKDKKPLTAHGFKDSSIDPSQIEKWFNQHPDCAWGTPTSSEYAVTDIDIKHNGDVTWGKLISQHGPLPPCPSVQTGSGGWHYVMRFPIGTGTSQNRVGQGIDIKAEGGYVIIPPSRIHDPEGRHVQAYRWEI